MERLLLFTALISIINTMQAQIKLETGLLIGGGKGNATESLYPDAAAFYKNYTIKNKLHFSLGYRFRLKPANSRFFYDLDLNIGIRSFNHNYEDRVDAEQWVHHTGSAQTYICGSLAGSANYQIYKGLSAGLGVEPRYNFFQSGDKAKSPAIEIPLVAKLAYNFRFLELGLAYKPTLIKSLQVGHLKSLRFNDWHLSVYIPF